MRLVPAPFNGVSSISRSLLRGVKIDKEQNQPEMCRFHAQSPAHHSARNAEEEAELDFFGFDQKKDTLDEQAQTFERNSEAQTSQTDITSEQNVESIVRHKKRNRTAVIQDNIQLFSSNEPRQASQEQSIDSRAVDREAIACFRRQMGIRVRGSHVPHPMTSFADLSVHEDDSESDMIRSILRGNIEKSEYKEPTPVQMQAIPSMLANRDVLATAPTGSGKTAAYVIPMIAKLACRQRHQAGTRSVIISPTRELAMQIHFEVLRLSKGKELRTLLLSKSTAATMQDSIDNTEQLDYDMVIATPLRLVHLVQENRLDLSSVETITLDEADRLFEMGFLEQIDEIIAACTNPQIQRAMFSATMLEGVEELAQSTLRDPIRICIGTKNAGAATIEQRLLFVGKEQGKLVAVKQLIQEGLKIPALLFVQNKDRANQLYQELLYDGLHIKAVHTDCPTEKRDEIIRQFRAGDVWLLVCTDLLSRGIDFKAVNMVINYDFPQSAVDYIHRIGRTGRNGQSGLAITYFTESDMRYVRPIANVIKISGGNVPDWMLSLAQPSVDKRKHLIRAPPKRLQIDTSSDYDLKKANKHKKMKQKRRKLKAQMHKNKETNEKKH